MSEIIIIPQGISNLSLLENLKNDIAALHGKSVSIQNLKMDLNSYYDRSRAQYNAIKIIQSIENKNGPVNLICTTKDLFIPIFTFVFGLAKLNGKTAIISTHRLENRYYGLPDDQDRLRQRLLKEAIHELGHLAGLRHCPQFDCVMAGSTSADEIDIKSHNHCESCRKKI